MPLVQLLNIPILYLSSLSRWLHRHFHHERAVASLHPAPPSSHTQPSKSHTASSVFQQDCTAAACCGSCSGSQGLQQDEAGRRAAEQLSCRSGRQHSRSNGIWAILSGAQPLCQADGEWGMLLCLCVLMRWQLFVLPYLSRQKVSCFERVQHHTTKPSHITIPSQMQVKPSDDTLRSAFGSIRSAGCALHQVGLTLFESQNAVCFFQTLLYVCSSLNDPSSSCHSHTTPDLHSSNSRPSLNSSNSTHPINTQLIQLQAFTHLGAGVVMGQVTTLCLHVPKCDLEALKVGAHLLLCL